MSKPERWAAIGAIGAMLAGISEIIKLMAPIVEAAWSWLPEVEFDLWLFVEVAGLLFGACGALTAIWLSLRRGVTHAQPAGIEIAPRRPNPSLMLAIFSLALTLTVAAAFFLTGGAHSVASTIDDTARRVRGDPPRYATDDPLEKVCADARREFRKRALRARRDGPAGIWTGWTTWLRGEQQWTLDPGRGVELTRGTPGKWHPKPGGLEIRFPRKTCFRAQIHGELMCGIRLKPDGNVVPDGNFRLVFVEPVEAEPEMDANTTDPI